MNDDSEILKISADLQSIDKDSIMFDMMSEYERKGQYPKMDCVSEKRDALISTLGNASPTTQEGARAQALALLPLLRDLDNGHTEDLFRLIQRVVACAAGVPHLGDYISLSDVQLSKMSESDKDFFTPGILLAIKRWELG